MTKQEKIQEAYGEYWEAVKGYADENGWIIEAEVKESISRFETIGRIPTTFYCIDFEADDNEHFQTILRPKTLIGIENNNGWIKIESEDDLPKETGTYHFVSRSTGVTLIDYFTHDSKVHNYFFMQRGLYSHYQPVQKPEPPIY